MSSSERRPALFTRHPTRVAICKATAHHSEDADTGGILSSLVLPVLPSVCVRTCMPAACCVSASPAQVCVSTVTQLCFSATLSQESGPRVPAPTPVASPTAGRMPAMSHVRCGPLLCCPLETPPTCEPRCLPALPLPTLGHSNVQEAGKQDLSTSLKGEESEY